MLDLGAHSEARAQLGHCLRDPPIPPSPPEQGLVLKLVAAFACLLIAEGQPERGLRLMGAVAAVHERALPPLSRSERTRLERSLATARAVVGHAVAGVEVAAGRAL
jgi:hypothetical protein